MDTNVDFDLQNYAQEIIIFDRYESFSIKVMTHKHQSKGKKDVSVSSTPEMTHSDKRCVSRQSLKQTVLHSSPRSEVKCLRLEEESESDDYFSSEL